MSHVFISYVRDDHEIVDRLSNELKRAGVEVWLDREQIRPGSRWRSTIEEAIEEGSFFIACFSRTYNERSRSHMNEELTLAIDELRRRPTDRAWFIPVVLDSCQVPDRRIGAGEKLTDIEWVSLERDWNKGINKLIDVILRESSGDPQELDLDMRDRARLWKRAERLGNLLTDLTSSDEDRRYAAAELGRMPSQVQIALPALQHALNDEDETVRISSVKGLAAMGREAAYVLVESLRNQSRDVRDTALSCLKEMASELSDVITDLIEAFQIVPETEDKLSLSDVLAAIGESAVPALLDAMTSQNQLIIQGAASALSKMCPAVASSAPCVFDALDHEDLAVRAAAVRVTRHLIEEVEGIDSRDAVVPLAHAMKDIKTRGDAFSAFYFLGDKADAAVPALIGILKLPVDDPLKCWNNHMLAKKALGYIGSAAIPALIQLIEDRESPQQPKERQDKLVTRRHALDALGIILRSNRAVIPSANLHGLVEDQDEHILIRCEAAMILAYNGQKTPRVMAVLIEAMKGSTGWNYLSGAATAALGNFRDEADTIIPLLIESLESGNVKSAAHALGMLGTNATPAIPALTKALQDNDHHAQAAAAEALGNIGTEAECAVSALTETLEHANSSVLRDAAEEALKKIRTQT